MLLKIGELAQRSGLTVRALHHYDKLGLLQPSARNAAGYRLYDSDDLSRLYRILALRELGLGLDQIADVLSGSQADMQRVIARQIDGLERQISQTQALRSRLLQLVERVGGSDAPNAEDWLVTLEMMTTYRKYFSDEEIAAWHALSSSQPEQAAQWPELVAAVRALMDAAVAPHHPEARALAWRWMRLVQQTMGNDPRFFKKLQAMHRNEPGVQAHTGIDGAVIDYITAAAQGARFEVYARYFSPDELARARAGHAQHGMAWLDLIAAVREAWLQQIPPQSPDVQDLLRRWNALFQACWGEADGLRERVRAAHAAEPELLLGSGIDAGLLSYLQSGFAGLAQNRKNIQGEPQ